MITPQKILFYILMEIFHFYINNFLVFNNIYIIITFDLVVYKLYYYF